jgi:hypothetical protein
MPLASELGSELAGRPRERQKWVFFGKQPRAKQGWKLYISANNNNFNETLRLVRPVLERHRVSFKHVADERSLRKINSGLYGYSQIGKTIVAYIDDETDADGLTRELKFVLKPFDGTTLLPPFAKAIAEGLPLSYRFGSFAGDLIVLNGIEILDERSRNQAALAGLPSDPFSSVTVKSHAEDELQKLLLEFPVFEVIVQSAKGGIFLALDLASPEYSEVILKLGRRNGNILPDGRDGMALVGREFWFFKCAAERGLSECLPLLVRFHKFSSCCVLVMEKIEGETLQHVHLRGDLCVEQVKQALEMLNKFHAVDLFVGDTKLSNFMVKADGSLKMIDFESGDILSARTGPDSHSSFYFTGIEVQASLRHWEQLHLLYSILHHQDVGSFDENDRVIDLEQFLKSYRCTTKLELAVREEMARIYSDVVQNKKGLEMALAEPRSTSMSVNTAG